MLRNCGLVNFLYQKHFEKQHRSTTMFWTKKKQLPEGHEVGQSKTNKKFIGVALNLSVSDNTKV